MNFKELLVDWSPDQVIEFKNYLSENIKAIISTTNGCSLLINKQNGRPVCSNCRNNLHKNGKTKNNVQKYICSNCKKTATETTNTLTYYSKLDFSIWKSCIDNIIDGLSIRRMAEKLEINKNTSFIMRHKILTAINSFVNKQVLSGEIEADEKYFKINLKGTKPEKMPRHSKKHSSSAYRGISHHKVCVVTAIDEYDNVFVKVTGLGPITTNMLETAYKNMIKPNSKMVTDSKSSYIKFCEDNKIPLSQIPSNFYITEDNKNLANINNFHSQLEIWLAKFKGVSNKHLQEYLNWFSYVFTMKRKFEAKKLELEMYKKLVSSNSYINVDEIFKKEYCIDLYAAYGEYHYGIFAN